ncbi:CMRF35-like molecule 8 [Labeo rohita]|uniref:CMRF35-like molecule 8 n=1 Tax=Labeo rohita TaxID=84645 RepID=A0A498NYU9_LABRO|nr:CMRF35-like molecule 8 [Labeo rohita]
MENSLAVTITGSVGSNISVTCSYPETYQNNSKFFCQMSSSFALGDVCVHITQQETRSEQGRLVLLDDTSAHVLTANISGLAPEDSGKYWCGVDIAQLPDFTLEIWITVTKACLRDTSCAKIGYEGKDITFKAVYPPDYETNTKYFGRTHDFFSFEKLVETSNCYKMKQEKARLDHIYSWFGSPLLKGYIKPSGACLRDTSCAKIGYEGKDITFKAVYPPDYETNTKYFGRTHDFFSFEKLVETSHPNRTNHRPVPKRAWRQVIVGFASTESYSRFMMMVAFICVGALFFVCLFGLFQVLKRNSCSNSGLVLHYSKAISNPVVDDHQRINLSDLPKVQNEKEELYRTTNPDHTNTKPDDRVFYNIDVVSAQTKDQIYTDQDSNRRSHVYQSLTANSLQELIYHTTDQKTD